MAKINLNREEMPRQAPDIRKNNFNEVALGYNEEQARNEASRCISCSKRPCTIGCPVGVDIPDFIAAFNKGDYACRENSLAMTAIEEALLWMKKRSLDRVARNVEGMSKK